MMGESTRGCYIIGQPDPYDIVDHGSGNWELRWSIRISHNNKLGLNFLYFDGHVAFDSDYIVDYDDDFASLMGSYWE